MSISRISELAARIATNTAKVNDYLVTNKLPVPSFDVDGPSESAVPKDQYDIEAARTAVIDDTQELRRLMLGPREYLWSKEHNELSARQVITRFRLAHTFPVGSEATFADIAEGSGLDERLVRKYIRQAVIQDIFAEPRPGVVKHTSVSRLLVENQVMHDWLQCSTGEMWPAAAYTTRALEKFSGSQEPNETAFALANNSDKSMYEILGHEPERARRFANAMRDFTQGPRYALRHVTDSFLWGELGNATVVDVGGSQGAVCFALAEKFPKLSLVVQDLEPVIRSAKKDRQSEFADRVNFMPYNFILSEQPVKNAEVYFFRWVLHNWSDKYCIKILNNLIPALKPGAKVIVCDGVLLPPGSMPRHIENRERSMDICMTETSNSSERDLDDWEKLFLEADNRFVFQGATQPPGSHLSMLVFEWKGN
ncbi:S-adenosyl-L-methionine-dependent methyltransferase [Xylariaceae sp. FL1651]|nr:S-adenosyl-L-methionine-dependent methyltransferase [Xylariaceae sp. FL1651]